MSLTKSPTLQRTHTVAAALVGMVLFLTLLPIPGATPTAEGADGYFVQPVYLVPVDAPYRGNGPAIDQATDLIQQQWNSWGVSWNRRELATVNSGQSCSYFQGNDPDNFGYIIDRMKAEVRSQIGDDARTIYLIFGQCTQTAWAAHGGGRFATFYDGVVNEIGREINLNSNDRNDIGAIGHELGHVFALPHENCASGENGPEWNAGNAAYLRSRGLPDGPTNAMMCNNSWPAIDAPVNYQRELMRNDKCNWIIECSGGALRITVEFANTGCRNLEVFWRSDGQDFPYDSLPPNSSRPQSTFQGHQWVFKIGNETIDVWNVTGPDVHFIDSGGCAPTPTPTPTATPTPTPTPEYPAGDVNCDGFRNIVDALVIAQYSAGVRAESGCDQVADGGIDLRTADVNEDGRVSIVDALIIAGCLAELC